MSRDVRGYTDWIEREQEIPTSRDNCEHGERERERERERGRGRENEYYDLLQNVNVMYKALPLTE